MCESIHIYMLYIYIYAIYQNHCENQLYCKKNLNNINKKFFVILCILSQTPNFGIINCVHLRHPILLVSLKLFINT